MRSNYVNISKELKTVCDIQCYVKVHLLNKIQITAYLLLCGEDRLVFASVKPDLILAEKATSTPLHLCLRDEHLATHFYSLILWYLH